MRSEGDTSDEIAGFPGGLVFNQISPVIILEEKLETVRQYFISMLLKFKYKF